MPRTGTSLSEDVILSIAYATGTPKTRRCPIYYTQDRKLWNGASALMDNLQIDSSIDEETLLKMGAAFVVNVV